MHQHHHQFCILPFTKILQRLDHVTFTKSLAIYSLLLSLSNLASLVCCLNNLMAAPFSNLYPHLSSAYSIASTQRSKSVDPILTEMPMCPTRKYVPLISRCSPPAKITFLSCLIYPSSSFPFTPLGNLMAVMVDAYAASRTHTNSKPMAFIAFLKHLL